jgi:hypothetical protein
MSTRSRVLSFGSAALLVLAGIAGAVLFSGTLGQVLALALISLGLVLATALVFLEVGLSEDRERARAVREAEDGGHDETPAAQTAAPRPRHATPRLGRMRGSRRRLP